MRKRYIRNLTSTIEQDNSKIVNFAKESFIITNFLFFEEEGGVTYIIFICLMCCLRIVPVDPDIEDKQLVYICHKKK